MEFVGIDKFSLLDYEDKISIVLFSGGCNFKCPFCHNGESVLNCKTFIPFNEILDYLKDRKNVIDAVVITGGEPTLMPELKERIIKIRELGYKIKLDTNGTFPFVVEDLINSGLVDYVAMDIKNSEKRYAETTGNLLVDIDRIKHTIHILESSNIDYEFRTTLVDEFHDEQSIKEMGELIKGAKKLYLQKFVDREGVIQKGLHEIPEEKARKFKEILENYVDFCELRGY